MIRFQEAIWLPRSMRADGRWLTQRKQIGVLETPSAVHRGTQKDALTGNREKLCYLIHRANTSGMYSEYNFY